MLQNVPIPWFLYSKFYKSSERIWKLKFSKSCAIVLVQHFFGVADEQGRIQKIFRGGGWQGWSPASKKKEEVRRLNSATEEISRFGPFLRKQTIFELYEIILVA